MPDGPEFEGSSLQAMQADALEVLAKHYLAGGSTRVSSAEQYQVVIHVDEGALRGDTETQGRSDLPIESVRRLTCDGAVIPMLSNADGEPLNVGRKQRNAPIAIKRASQSATANMVREARFEMHTRTREGPGRLHQDIPALIALPQAQSIR